MLLFGGFGKDDFSLLKLLLVVFTNYAYPNSQHTYFVKFTTTAKGQVGIIKFLNTPSADTIRNLFRYPDWKQCKYLKDTRSFISKPFTSFNEAYPYANNKFVPKMNTNVLKLKIKAIKNDFFEDFKECEEDVEVQIQLNIPDE